MKIENKNYKFNKENSDILLSSRDEVKIMNVALTQKTYRSIDIISRFLDSNVFDNTDFLEAIKKLSISSKFTRIRILIQDSEPMIKSGHRIIELIHQLTSSIEVRKISDEFKSDNQSFSIFDGKGILYLRSAERYNGFANFDRPRLATELSNTFNETWEHSEPDINLRRLYI